MSYMDEYNALRKKKKKDDETSTSASSSSSGNKSSRSSFMEEYFALREGSKQKEKEHIGRAELVRQKRKEKKKEKSQLDDDDDIAPVKSEDEDDDIAPVYNPANPYDRIRASQAPTKEITQKILHTKEPKATPATLTDVLAGMDIGDIKLNIARAENPEMKRYYTGLLNQKQTMLHAETLAKTEMEGTEGSVLDEMIAVTEMEDGKEKRKRKKAVKEKMDDMGIDSNVFYSLITGDKNVTFGNTMNLIGQGALSGFSAVNESITKTLDATAGNLLRGLGWENNPISALDDYYGEVRKDMAFNAQLAQERMGSGKGVGIAGEVIEGTAAALPQAIMALMTAGTSTATTSTALANQAAMQSGSLLTKAGLTTSAMLRNPQYWTSFAQTYGNDYEEALQNGASEGIAGLTATLKSLINAGIEIGIDGGSGVQGLPDDILEGSGKTWRKLFESGFEEGDEEVAQGIISKLISRIFYDEDEEVLNPKEMATEWGMGAAIGWLLGGGQTVAINAMQNADAKARANYLTENEQLVVKKEIDDRIAELKKKATGDKKISKKDIAKIEERVRSDLKKGYISTDTIEEVLGGDTYKAYKELVDSEDALVNQEKTLSEESKKLEGKVWEQMTGEQQLRRDELRDLLPELQNQIRNNENSSTRKDLKSKLENEVMNKVRGDRLIESYAEKARVYQKLDIDPETFSKAKHAEAAKQTVASAVELGANNTNRVRDLVEHAAQISGKTGKAFIFKDNETIKNSFIERQTKAIEKLEQIENRDAKQNKLLDAMKQKLEDVKSGKIIVNGENSADGIVLNIDSKNPLMVTVGHEVTHDTENVKHYDKMKKALFAYAKTKGIDVETRIAMAKAEYEGIADADAEHEVVADLVGEMLFTDDAFVEHLARTDTNVFQNLWNDIKNLVKMATPGSKEAKELANLEHKFEKAFREANKAQKNTTEDGGGKYSLVGRTADGLGIYKTNYPPNTPKAKKQADLIELVQNTWSNKPITLTIIEDGKYVDITAKFNPELTGRSDLSKIAYGNRKGNAAEKRMTLDLASDLYQIAQESRFTFSKDATPKPGNPAHDGVTKYHYFLTNLVYKDNGGNYIPCHMNIDVKRNSEGDWFYSFAIEKGSVPQTLLAAVTENSATLPKDIVTAEEPAVKEKFSLSSAVEKTKNLVALHNLSEDKLFKSLELGGLPMPSIAITKSDIPHSNFGEITLIFGRETIDPKVNKKNKTYSADAWTPVFPRVEYEENSEVATKVSRKLHGLYNKVDDTFRRELGLVSSGFEHYLNRNGGEEGLIERVKDNYGLKAAFLEEQGKHIDKVTTTKEVEKGYNPANADKYQKVADILGVTTKDEIGKLPFKAVTDAQKAELEKIYPGISSTTYRMSRIFGMVGAYLDGQNSETKYETVTDYEATNKAVDDALDVEAYDAWVRNLFSGIEKSSGIYNNKDIFTPSGNRRTFAQTHLPVTLENIVKAMATQNGGNTKNVSGFNGIKTLRAATAETFKSVDEMHKREGRLQNLSEEQLEEVQNELQTRLYNIIDTIDKESGRSGYDNEFMRFDTIGNILTEIGESGKYNVADIQKVLKEYGRDVSDDTAMQVKQLLYDVTQMPVNIFEAKPARVVGFDEAKVFVIPNNADPKLKQELLNRGYSIAEYDPDVEGNRQKVVNQFEEYRFSLSDANAQPTAKGITGKDFRVKTESVAPTYDVAGATPETNIESRIRPNVAVEEAPVAPMPVETAPVAPSANATLEEKRRLLQIEKDDLDWMRGASGDYTFEKMQAEANIARLEKEIAELESAPVAPMDDIAPVAENATTEDIAPMPAIDTRQEVYAESDDIAPIDGKRRKWIGTSTESEVVDGQILPDDLDQELIHYQPISNKKTLGNANSMLDSMGYESSVSYMNQRFASSKVSLDDIALGERLIQEAVKRGDTETAKDLIMDISILGTELGQKVQALSIIKRLTPEGQLKMLMRTIERGKAKNDKAFEGVEVTNEMAKEILDTRNADGTYDQDALNAAVENVKNKIAKEMKISVMDVLNEWRYLSMLGNPKTHIRNLVSNMAMWGTRQVKNAVARTGETFFGNKIERTKTWMPASNEVKAFAKQVTQQEYGADKTSKYSEVGDLKSRRQVLPIKALDAIARANSFLLSAEDTWFSKPAYRQALQEYLTANGIRTEEDIKKNGKLIAKAKQYAMQQAQEATFQQDSYIANKLIEIERKNVATNVMVGSVMTFKKTPINIGKTALAYSPLGFARNIYDTVKVAKGEMNVSTAIDHFAQSLTGTSLAVIGYVLASRGILNGAGKDDKEGKYDYQLGKQSYSFNFDGDSFSLSWLSPVAMPLFVGANAYEILVEDKDWDYNVVGEALAQTLDPMNEMSFLSSLTDVLSSYDSGMAAFGGMLESAGQSYITSFVPTLSSQIAQVTDDKKRSTKIDANSGQDFLDETWNQIKYKIPGFRQTLEPSTDIWGNEIPLSENAVTKALETFILPYSRKDNIATKVDEEIKKVYRLTGENGVIPNVPYNYINYKKEKYEMTAAEHTDFKRTYGQTAYNWLEKLVETDTFQNATPTDQAELMEKVYDYAMDEAKKVYLARQGVKYTNASKGDVEYYKENAIKGAIRYDMTPDEYNFFKENPEKYNIATAVGGYEAYTKYKEATKDMKLAEKTNYIAGMDLTTEQKNILINSETDRKEPIDLTGYENYSSLEEFDFAKNNPESYAMAKSVGGYEAYKEYSDVLGDIKSDKNEWGESIRNSRKPKVKEYIYSLDIPDIEKHILFKSEYPSTDTYNRQIVEYLDSRDDISWEEMKAILIKLDFKVSDDGVIKW